MIFCSESPRSYYIFKKEEILPLDDLIFLNICKFMFDYFHGRLPIGFFGTWMQNGERENYALRNYADFYIPNRRYMYLSDHPIFLYPKIWNDLNNDIKMCENRCIFINKIKQTCFQALQ